MAPNRIYLHAVKPEDLEYIFEIEKRSFRVPWSLNMFRDEISNPLSRSIVAKRWNSGAEILGYLFYQVVSFEMHILNLAVHPSFRSRGIGTALLKEGFMVEREKGTARYAFLEVRENNKTAIRLYRKLGFKQLGLRKNYYSKEKVNAIVMGRPID